VKLWKTFVKFFKISVDKVDNVDYNRSINNKRKDYKMSTPLKIQVQKIEEDTEKIKNIGDELTDIMNKMDV
jgi:hypothetical protein